MRIIPPDAWRGASGNKRGWNIINKLMNSYIATTATGDIIVEITDDRKLMLNGTQIDIEISKTSTVKKVKFGNRYYDVFVQEISPMYYEIWINHRIIPVRLQDSREQIIAKLNRNLGGKREAVTMKAPMPGMVTRIEIELGQRVDPGTGLLILEAMKMENEIKSPINGHVKSIDVVPNSTVEKGQTLLVIDPL